MLAAAQVILRVIRFAIRISNMKWTALIHTTSWKVVSMTSTSQDRDQPQEHVDFLTESRNLAPLK